MRCSLLGSLLQTQIIKGYRTYLIRALCDPFLHLNLKKEKGLNTKQGRYCGIHIKTKDSILSNEDAVVSIRNKGLNPYQSRALCDPLFHLNLKKTKGLNIKQR